MAVSFRGDGGSGPGRGRQKVDLPQRHIGGGHGDGKAVADCPAAAGQWVVQGDAIDHLRRTGAQRLGTHQPLDGVIQHDINAERGHGGDDALGGLAQMLAHIFRLIAILAAALDRHGDQLTLAGGLRGARGKFGPAAAAVLRGGALAIGGENAVNGKIGVAADGTGEMGVIGQ